MSLKKSKQKLVKGDAIPDFKLRGTDGDKHDPQEFKEDYLLIVFTCNHCPYAQSKIGVLNELAEEEDLLVVGINPNSPSREEDSFQKMKEWVKDGRISYDLYLDDKEQQVAKKFGAVCTPDPFLFKKEDGEYKLVYHGRLDDALNPEEEPSKSYIRKALRSMRKGQDVDLEFMPSQGCSIKWKD